MYTHKSINNYFIKNIYIINYLDFLILTPLIRALPPLGVAIKELQVLHLIITVV